MAETPELRSKLQALIDQLTAEGGLTTTNINKLGSFVKDNPDFMAASDVQSEMARLQAEISASPQQRALLEGMLRKRQADKISAQVAPFVQAALAGTDIVTALGQIGESKRGARGLRRPIRPSALGPSPELNAALSDARGRVNDVDDNVLNALRLQGLDAYMGDLSNARTASGGQAGLYGSLAQGAVNRRNRAATSSLPMLAQLQAQNRQRYDSLLSQQGQREAITSNQGIANYNADLDQYNREASAVGRLGATGRQNLRNSIYNAGAQMPNLLGMAATSRFPRRNANGAMPAWGSNQVSGYGDSSYQPAAQPRYTPDVYELGPENVGYLGAIQSQSEASLYGDMPPMWEYKINMI